MEYRRFVRFAAGTIVLSMAWTTVSNAAFQCPAQPLEGTRASSIAASLPTGDAFDDPTALVTTVNALKAEGVGLPLIVDNLIAAYCPTVDSQSSLTDAQKAEMVNQFAARITRTVYNLDSADEILLEVAFPPLVMDSVNAKAKTAGVSAAEWVQGIVEEALD
ncbi:MAG: hypothetical protein JNK47_21980 [Mesorhizobium sp.]|nr:hypothetical protein [Mesorhizobium sp.]MBL8579883.1 hypothetical protein [Mesorhizobium sp.]